MRIRVFFLLLLVMFVLFPSNIRAQDVIVKRSSHIETYKGKTYYFHFVEQGQTLGAIAKAYNVSTQDIIAENPLAEKGLQPDMILRIPQNTEAVIPVETPATEKVAETAAKQPAPKEQPQVAQEPDYTIYLVKKKETLYGISKQFNVSVDDILNANPGLTVLKEGMKIKIPSKKSYISPKVVESEVKLPQAVKEDSLPDEIVVKTGETLYSISKQHKVTVDELIDLNPQLSGGLKAGMVIKLRKGNAVKAEKAEAKPEKGTPVKPEKNAPVKPANTGNCYNPENSKKTYQVALLLPFLLNEATDVLDASDDKSPSEFENFNYFQFYAGFMLAADSLEKCGLRARIEVLDAEKMNDTLTIRQTLRKPGLDKMDLLVGPLYAPSFSIAARFAEKNKICIVNPLSRRETIVDGNPWVVKAQVSAAGSAARLYSFISEKFPEANIIIVRNDNKEHKPLADAFKMLVNGGIESQAFRGTLQESVYSTDFMGGVTKKLKSGQKNFVILFSNNKTVVPNFVSLLNPFSKSNDIVLVGMDGWDELELETEFLVSLNYHQLSSDYIDFDSEPAQAFITRFRARYGAMPLPSKYAFLGYDIGWYFLTSMMWYGDKYESCLQGNPGIGLQYNFNFTSSKQGDGLQNSNISILKLQDYKMVPAE